jgi:hypothetical protein
MTQTIQEPTTSNQTADQKLKSLESLAIRKFIQDVLNEKDTAESCKSKLHHIQFYMEWFEEDEENELKHELVDARINDIKQLYNIE